VVPTPDLEPTKHLTDALFAFKLYLQSQHRAEATIRNRMCSGTIMAKLGTADALDDLPRSTGHGWRSTCRRSRASAKGAVLAPCTPTSGRSGTGTSLSSAQRIP